jgi:hypothetical protein
LTTFTWFRKTYRPKNSNGFLAKQAWEDRDKLISAQSLEAPQATRRQRSSTAPTREMVTRSSSLGECEAGFYFAAFFCPTCNALTLFSLFPLYSARPMDQVVNVLLRLTTRRDATKRRASRKT